MLKVAINKAINGFIQNIRTMTSAVLSKVPDVDIDEEGKFKYILIKLTAPAEGDNKLLVRGYASCGYHTDINDKVLEGLLKLQESGVLPECSTKVLGGGSMMHDAENKSIKVYGESQGYGKADHETTVSLLKKVYKDYDISWTDEAS